MDKAAIRYKAMDLMAGREHCRAELFRKLTARYADQDALVDQVLNELEAEGLLSDSRYVDMFIENSARRGRGPLRIQQELKQKGVSEALIRDALSSMDVDWYQLAQQVLVKKYLHSATGDNTQAIELSYKEKAKRMRFLQSRGFSHEQINACFSL